MKLYVMRHGQTDWNVLRKIQGRTDIELNETGMKQAQKAKEEFSQYGIDLILSSPLKRAKKTAEIISEGTEIPILYEKQIVERNFGDFEGCDPRKVEKFRKNNEGWEYFWNYTVNSKEYHMESVVEICDRVWNFLDEIKEKYQEKNVLLVTHGGTAKVINAYFYGIDENGILKETGFQNCEIREYKFEEIKIS